MKFITKPIEIFLTPHPQIFAHLLEKKHPARINEYLSARSLLIQALKEKGHNPELNDLAQLNHQTLINFPQYTFSLSHTKELAALVLEDKNKHPYLGIDIELKTRKMGPKVADYLNHPDDDREFGLEKWVIKEAAFKYFSSKYQKENFWLKSLSIKDNKVFFESDFCFYELHDIPEYLCAICYREEVP